MSRSRIGRLALLASASFFALVACQGLAAHAQDTEAKVFNFNLPKQPLRKALLGFSNVTGLDVVADGTVTQTARDVSVSGNMTPAQALNLMLQGTGASFRFTNRNTVVLENAEVSNARAQVELETINVEGETAWSPIKGYVAQRSATGTKTDASLISTPQSISVVTRDQIDAQQATSLKDALRYTAGVAAENRAAFDSTDIVYARGFILNRFVDGMKLQGDAGFIVPQPEIYGIERVEVLRGPASVLYGQSSLGGIINAVSKRPTEKPFGEIQLQGGQNDRFQGAFDFGGPIAKNGEFSYRLTGLSRQADSQVDFVKTERQFIAPSFTWKPTADTTWTVLANYQHDPSAGLYNFVPYKGSVGANPNGTIPTNFYAGNPNYNKISRTQASITSLFEHRFDSVWTIRQNTRYMNSNGDLNQILPYQLLADNRTLVRYGQMTHDDISTISTDNQAQAEFTTGPLRHTVLMGLDYQNTLFTERLTQGFVTQNFDIFNPGYGPVTVGAPVVSTYSQQRQSQIGLYLQDQIKLNKLTLLFSGRHDSAKTDNRNLLNNTAVKTDDGAYTSRVGAVYEFDSGIAPYATYATSFNPQLGTGYGTVPFKPTTGTLYEGGVKFQPKGYNSFIQMSVYDLTQQNVLTTDPAHSGFSIQTGEINSRGFEFEGKLSLSDRLDLIGTYGYSNPKVTSSNSTDLGKIPVNVPRHIASAWGDYTIRDGRFNGLGFGLGVRYTGETFADSANTLRVPSYTVTDAAIHYELVNLNPALKGTKLAINATNLFDKIYASQCTNLNCVYGLRRQVVATLSYRW